MPTPILAFPFPDGGDPANVPGDIQALAERAEEILVPAGIQAGDALIWGGAGWARADAAAQAGISAAGVVRRGKSIIATEESRTNTAYGLLATPDRVQNVVLPTDGLLLIGYQAQWKESVAAASRAAFFIGATQQKIATGFGSAPVPVAAATGGSPTNTYRALFSHLGGLGGSSSGGAADVTTGQAIGLALSGATGSFWEVDGGVVGLYNPAASVAVPVGGLCVIFAAAGTYDVSVQFKASSGSVTVKERKLWVWTMGF